jgi:hypothetical protein
MKTGLKVPEFSNTTGIFSALNKQKTFDWKKFLSGWIIEKNYRGLSLSEWSDTDLDGLLDVQERYYGTDKKIPDTDGDSLADGTEIEIGSNPLKRETPIEIEKLVSESGPFIDGFSGDWDVIKNKKVLQSSPNPKLQGRFDLIEFSFIIKNKTFYGMIKTREKPFFDSLSEKDMYFFFSDTAEPKFRDGFGMWYSPSARLGWEYGRKSGKSVIPEGRLAEVFEFKISIPDSDPRYMKLYPIIRHGKKNENFGIWDNYKEIMIQF